MRVAYLGLVLSAVVPSISFAQCPLNCPPLVPPPGPITPPSGPSGPPLVPPVAPTPSPATYGYSLGDTITNPPSSYNPSSPYSWNYNQTAGSSVSTSNSETLYYPSSNAPSGSETLSASAASSPSPNVAVQSTTTGTLYDNVPSQGSASGNSTWYFEFYDPSGSTSTLVDATIVGSGFISGALTGSSSTYNSGYSAYAKFYYFNLMTDQITSEFCLSTSGGTMPDTAQSCGGSTALSASVDYVAQVYENTPYYFQISAFATTLGDATASAQIDPSISIGPGNNNPNLQLLISSNAGNAQVPEPGSLLLFGSAAAGFAALRRRRSKQG